MTVLWRAITAGSEWMRQVAASAVRAATPVLSSVVAAAVLGAALWVQAAPAGASPIGTLQQQAAALSQQMLLEQLQIGGFEQQRAADIASVAADDAQLQQLQAELDATRHRIGADLLELRDAAVTAYVEGGTQADGTSSPFAASPSNGASSVYAQVLSGDLNSAVAKLQADRHALSGEEATHAQIAAQAQRTLENANVALASAQAAEQKLAQQHASVTGELAVAVAAQQAQQAAAARAAAARAAAASAAAASAAAQASADPGGAQSPTVVPAAPAPPSSSGAMPQLNTFLRCVVQAESSGNYQAISPTGQYMGAFQFSQPTWNEAAQLAGMPTLVGVPPYDASPRDQDLLAIALYNADGEQPWYDPCRN
ncbi:MAG: lysozyme family protein [Acidimicrobiales bacterium]